MDSTRSLLRKDKPAIALRRFSVASEQPATRPSKAERMAATEIAFVDHPYFRRRNGLTLVEALRPEFREDQPPIRTTGPGIAFLPELVRASLLTIEQERYLFLKMNYLRFRAEQTRRRLRPSQSQSGLVTEIETLLAEAQSIRNRIAEANVRLLVAAAKKLCRSLDQLGDFISEGLIPLMRAIDLFDVSRGHRFSTYATWAARNQMVRLLIKQRTLPELALSEEQAQWQHIPDERPPRRDETGPLKQQEFVTRLIQTLSDREQQIVRARFGLDGEPAGQSLAEISLQMGLSKERIRQLAMKALEKMRLEAEACGCPLEDEVYDVP